MGVMLCSLNFNRRTGRRTLTVVSPRDRESDDDVYSLDDSDPCIGELGSVYDTAICVHASCQCGVVECHLTLLGTAAVCVSVFLPVLGICVRAAVLFLLRSACLLVLHACVVYP